MLLPPQQKKNLRGGSGCDNTFVVGQLGVTLVSGKHYLLAATAASVDYLKSNIVRQR